MNNTIQLLITGDFYGGGRIDTLIAEEKYSEIFNDFLPVIQQSDLAITNLESALLEKGTSIEKTGPPIKSSPKTIKALEFAGFKLVSLANNHIMDFGMEGLQSTLNACKAHSIDHVGAGKDQNDASMGYFKEIKGKRVAVLNFAENEFSTTHDNSPGANPVDPINNFRDIQVAKGKADYVIVIVHGGHEMYNLPSPRMKKLLRFYADAGASAVIAHHTHCYSGYEVYRGIPIFYSLGNFIFDNEGLVNREWNYGYAVRLELGHQIGFTLIPYEQCNPQAGVKLLINDKDVFEENIERLNTIIQNDASLYDEFNKYCGRVRKLYSFYLEPYSIRLLHHLRNRGIIPSVLSKRKKLLYLNLIRCESHRDVVINILRNDRRK